MVTLAQLNEPLRRSTDTAQFVGRLADARDAAVDVVAPQSSVVPVLHEDGRIRAVADLVRNGEPSVLSSGVYRSIEGAWTDVAWRQTAERLNVPGNYLFRLRDHAHPLAQELAVTTVIEMSRVHDRDTLWRWWRAVDGWQLRAVLSSRYKAIDNWTVLQAVSAGMEQADHRLGDCEIDVDWTDTRFRMRIAVPAVQIAAPDLLANYRSPFLRPGEDVPVLWAGVEVSNSETGHGAFSVSPRAVVLKCRNGLTENVTFRKTHIGASLEEGVIDWSSTTYQAAADLLQAQVRDAVATFVSPTYLSGIVDRMSNAKSVPVVNVDNAVNKVREAMALTDREVHDMLMLFNTGNEPSVLGLGHALTAVAGQATNGERQAELENGFWQICGRPVAYAG